MDIFTPDKRSDIMSRISSSGTLPERRVKKKLWAQGFRYARSAKGLPGSPDVVLPRLRSVVFVHGCFWHGHTCKRAALPASNTEFWRAKIGRNMARDARSTRSLRSLGWACFHVWQCQLEWDVERIIKKLRHKQIALPPR